MKTRKTKLSDRKLNKIFTECLNIINFYDVAEYGSQSAYEQYHWHIADLEYDLGEKIKLNQNKLKAFILNNDRFKTAVKEMAAYMAQDITEEWNEASERY